MTIDTERLLKGIKKYVPDTITPDMALLAEIRMILACKQAVWRHYLRYTEEEIEQLSIEFIERKLIYSHNKNEES